jgi:hypothetical protein
MLGWLSADAGARFFVSAEQRRVTRERRRQQFSARRGGECRLVRQVHLSPFPPDARPAPARDSRRPRGRPATEPCRRPPNRRDPGRERSARAPAPRRCREQRLDFAPDLEVAAAARFHEAPPRGRRMGQGLVEDTRRRAASARATASGYDSSRRSQARVSRQSRITVATETSSASAVSSTLRAAEVAQLGDAALLSSCAASFWSASSRARSSAPVSLRSSTPVVQRHALEPAPALRVALRRQ